MEQHGGEANSAGRGAAWRQRAQSNLKGEPWAAEGLGWRRLGWMRAEAPEERAAEGVTARERWLVLTGGQRRESGGMAWSGQAGLACEAKQLVSARRLAEGHIAGVRLRGV